MLRANRLWKETDVRNTPALVVTYGGMPLPRRAICAAELALTDAGLMTSKQAQMFCACVFESSHGKAWS